MKKSIKAQWVLIMISMAMLNTAAVFMYLEIELAFFIAMLLTANTALASAILYTRNKIKECKDFNPIGKVQSCDRVPNWLYCLQGTKQAGIIKCLSISNSQLIFHPFSGSLVNGFQSHGLRITLAPLWKSYQKSRIFRCH